MKINRRDFLETSALASSGILLEQALPMLTFPVPANFSLTILATNWGFVGNYDEFCAKAKASGYDGIEVWLPKEEEQQKALFKALEKHKLKFGLLAGGNSSNFEEHFLQFKQALEAAVAVKPLFVNCHSGKDYFTFKQNKELIDLSLSLSEKSRVPISHETHRARILFAAHITRMFITEIPQMRLTLDISHWCNVHSSLLADQKESVDLALTRVDHIHSRVGHENAPQVSDPRAPEWQRAVEAHFEWWDKVVEYKVKANQPLTMTTEFGPPSYMPTLPFTHQPVTDLWGVNVHMMELWRKRYQAK